MIQYNEPQRARLPGSGLPGNSDSDTQTLRAGSNQSYAGFEAFYGPDLNLASL